MILSVRYFSDRTISSYNIVNNVDGNNTQEGTITSQILGQAKRLGIVEQLCSCLLSRGTNLASSSCSSAPSVNESCKAIWGLLKNFNIWVQNREFL